MIEPARIIVHGKIKASMDAVKDNIKFWNDLHQLGLENYKGKVNAATWTIANCVIAAREATSDLTELLLLVARRQPEYKWVIGMYPETLAQECWNRLLRLFWQADRSDAFQLVEPSHLHVSREVELLTRIAKPPRQLLIDQVEKRLRARYSESERARHFAHEMEALEAEVEKARAFQRDQEALPDLAPEQLAAAFLQMIPKPRPVGRPIQTPVESDQEPTPELPLLLSDGLPNPVIARKYHKDYKPETAQKILDSLKQAWDDHETVGGRWGSTMIGNRASLAPGTVSHYLRVFRNTGLTVWRGIRLP